MRASKVSHRGFSLADVAFALVILTTVIFGSMRLYADITRKKLDLVRSHEAESLLLSLHEKEKGNLFSYPLGPIDKGTIESGGRAYEVTMTLTALDSYPDDQLREIEYRAQYDIRGSKKERKVVRRAERFD